MASDLPNEIWIKIIENLPDRQSIAAISGTCKGLHSLSNALLYRQIDIGFPFEPSHDTPPLADRESLAETRKVRRIQHLFLLTILVDNPSLANHIEEFSWVVHGQSVRAQRFGWLSVRDPKVRREQACQLDGSAFLKLLSLLNNVQKLCLMALLEGKSLEVITDAREARRKEQEDGIPLYGFWHWVWPDDIRPAQKEKD
ncbi:MAG: hypothetical protein Q9165_007913 [Trypethelium subeluteriae]